MSVIIITSKLQKCLDSFDSHDSEKFLYKLDDLVFKVHYVHEVNTDDFDLDAIFNKMLLMYGVKSYNRFVINLKNGVCHNYHQKSNFLRGFQYGVRHYFKTNIMNDLIQVSMHPSRIEKHLSYYNDLEEALDNL